MITTEFSDGHSWVVIDDDSWSRAILTDYTNGFSLEYLGRR
jgi:hypothetical protein